ncbi:MAG: C4-type zinc ribbon domain-containing protein [Desulfobacterales bacterium]
MPSVTHEQITALVKLQRIEIEIRGIKAKLSTVDHRIEILDNQLLDVKQTLEDQESLIHELNQKYRTYESDVQMHLDRIRKSEAKLSAVKTNKEYQSSLKEIDDLKDMSSKKEDDMIEFLDRIEEAENVLKAKIAEFSKLEVQIKTEKEIIQKDAQEGRQRLGNLGADRETVCAGIDAKMLATFNQIKANQTNKIGIVAVKDAVCQGCHMNIPPQMYNELQRGDSLKRCPICERIIYWKDQDRRSE